MSILSGVTRKEKTSGLIKVTQLRVWSSTCILQSLWTEFQRGVSDLARPQLWASPS